jgi:hypothetical protein
VRFFRERCPSGQHSSNNRIAGADDAVTRLHREPVNAPLLFSGVVFLNSLTFSRTGESFRTPFKETVTDDCTGEEIAFEGWVHVNYNVHEEPFGFRANSHSNYQGVRGVGLTSGRKYRLVGSQASIVDFRRPFPSHTTAVDSVRLLAQGAPANSHYKVHLHYTANANGVITAVIDRVEVECRGSR